MSGGRSDEDTVNLKVQFNKDGVQTFFRVKRSTKLHKLMEAFCKNRSLDPKSIEFTFDSVRLEKNKTPEQERTTKSKRELNIISNLITFWVGECSMDLYMYGFNSKGLGAINSGLQLGMEDGDLIDALVSGDGA
ncbi:PREDICTED: small ubiquitin-related modifier 1-like [Prunus mume]|uniref:Small ubiquitin-related modifier 1-like n=1 Tax=Prunus mume TaxID=102107 RepID=A0ABM0NNR3_PRUMU|nr:PREDICTED: small ubiquitin-related modifier 1-like [Prunus mume]